MRSSSVLGVASSILMACRGDGAPVRPPPPTGSGSAVATPAEALTCEAQPFAGVTPVPEASGAAWMTIDGKLQLVVIGDSGNDGAYGIVDPETGVTAEQGKLPLGGGGDDLEGVAIRDGKLFAVTSAGWIRVWQREAQGFALVDGPYPLGPVTLPDKGRARPSDGDGMVCAEKHSNCGRDYEGLCLPPQPATEPGACVGFALSKTDGTLYCLTITDGRLAVDRSRAIWITGGGQAADCAFSEAGVLWVGSNLFDKANVYRVSGWQDPAHAHVDNLGTLGIGFPETIAIRGDVIYRMSDTGGAPSLMAKYRCK